MTDTLKSQFIIQLSGRGSYNVKHKISGQIVRALSKARFAFLVDVHGL